MTLSDQFLTLIAFPFCFVIQLVTIDKVVSNYLISGDDIISNYPIGWRGVSLANTPSGDNLVPCHPGLQSSVNELRICNHEWSEDLIKAVKTVQQYVTVGSLAYQRLRIIEPLQGSVYDKAYPTKSFQPLMIANPANKIICVNLCFLCVFCLP